MIDAYIGFGSNQDNPVQQVTQAISRLSALSGVQVRACSSLYKTPPWGNREQPDFINAVVGIATTYTPHELLENLQRIEAYHKRQRTVHWGPRTLDCDVLLYGNKIHHDEVITLPHPQMNTRGFVLMPLSEIAPTLVLPHGEKISDLLAKCDCTGIEKLC